MKFNIEIECEKPETAIRVFQALSILLNVQGTTHVVTPGDGGIVHEITLHGVKDASPGDPTPEPTARTTV